MDTYRTAGQQNTTGNPLCDRLQREFRGRGLDAVQVQNESTAEMIRRIQMGLNPYENVPDPKKPTVSEIPTAVRRQNAVPQQTAHPRKPAHAAASAVSQVKPNRQKAAGVVRPAGGTKTMSAAEARRRSAEAAAKRAKEKRRSEEIRVRAPFPFAAVSLLSVFTVMFMVLLFSFAQNYELTSEISTLEDQAKELIQLEKELSVQLEERDDIRVIENIAVNELGMVKNDLVESRFVSVTGGDRVELAEETEKESLKPQSGIFSTMLSTLGENWERLLEYIE